MDLLKNFKITIGGSLDKRTRKRRPWWNEGAQYVWWNRTMDERPVYSPEECVLFDLCGYTDTSILLIFFSITATRSTLTILTSTRFSAWEISESVSSTDLQNKPSS